MSWVDVQLEDHAAGGSILRLEHIAHVPDEFWNQYGPGATGVGWEQALLGLALHVAAGEAAITPENAEAWLASDNGKAFVGECSEAWGRISIAAGTEPSAARAAAQRTTEFYSG